MSTQTENNETKPNRACTQATKEKKIMKNLKLLNL